MLQYPATQSLVLYDPSCHQLTLYRRKAPAPPSQTSAPTRGWPLLLSPPLGPQRSLPPLLPPIRSSASPSASTPSLPSSLQPLRARQKRRAGRTEVRQREGEGGEAAVSGLLCPTCQQPLPLSPISGQEAERGGKRRRTDSEQRSNGDWSAFSSAFLHSAQSGASSPPSSPSAYTVQEASDDEAGPRREGEEADGEEQTDGRLLSRLPSNGLSLSSSSAGGPMAPFVSSDYFRLLHFAFARERERPQPQLPSPAADEEEDRRRRDDGWEAAVDSGDGAEGKAPVQSTLPLLALPSSADSSSPPDEEATGRTAGWLLASTWSPRGAGRRGEQEPLQRPPSTSPSLAKTSPSSTSPLSTSAPSSTASFSPSSSPSPSSGVPRVGLHSSSFVTGYYDRFFRRGRKLGGGSFGAVYLTHHVLEDVELGVYACKIIPVGDSKEYLLKVSREVRALEAVRHRHVVSYKHSWLEVAQIADYGPAVPCLYVLMEYCNSGTVAELVWPKHGSGGQSSAASATAPNAGEGDEGDQRRSELHRIKAQRREKRLQGQAPRRTQGKVEAEEEKEQRSPSARPGSPPSPSPSPSPSVAYLLEEDVWWLFLDCCLGLRHLHRLAVVHCDLKLENLLLTADVDARGQLQARRLLISDMGNALVKGAEHRRTGTTGTLQYSAPETLLDSAEGTGERPDREGSHPSAAPPSPSTASPPPASFAGVYSESTDMWSMGVILFALAFSRLPYASNDAAALYEEIHRSPLRIPLSPRRSPELVALVKRLLSVEPQQRPDCEQILAHPAIVRRREERTRSAEGRPMKGADPQLRRPSASAAPQPPSPLRTPSGRAASLSSVATLSPAPSPSPPPASPTSLTQPTHSEAANTTALVLRPPSQRRFPSWAASPSFTVASNPGPPTPAPTSTAASPLVLSVRLSPSLLSEVALHCAGLLVHVVCVALRSGPSTSVTSAILLDAAGTRALAFELAPLVLLSCFCVCAAINAHSEEAVGGRGQGPAERQLGGVGRPAPTFALRRWSCSLPVRAAVAAAMAVYTGGQGVRAGGGGGAGSEWAGVSSGAALLALSVAVGLAACLS